MLRDINTRTDVEDLEPYYIDDIQDIFDCGEEAPGCNKALLEYLQEKLVKIKYEISEITGKTRL